MAMIAALLERLLAVPWCLLTQRSSAVAAHEGGHEQPVNVHGLTMVSVVLLVRV